MQTKILIILIIFCFSSLLTSKDSIEKVSINNNTDEVTINSCIVEKSLDFKETIKTSIEPQNVPQQSENETQLSMKKKTLSYLKEQPKKAIDNNQVEESFDSICQDVTQLVDNEDITLVKKKMPNYNVKVNPLFSNSSGKYFLFFLQ